MEVAPQTTAPSKYTGRWRHRLKLVFRAWPKYKKAHEAIASMDQIRIAGVRMGDDGSGEVWSAGGRGACVFELSDEDFDTLTAIPKAGARMLMSNRGGMVVRAPGTTDSRVKKECWLDVPVFAYHDAPEGMVTMWGDGWRAAAPHEIVGETPEDALGMAGAPCGRVVFFERDADVDEDLIWREVVENDAMVVLNRRPARPGGRGVTAETGRRLLRKSLFWTVPGRRPWEDGGALRGYQFPDRIVRWTRRPDGGDTPENAAAHLRLMHEAIRERGRASRRAYFLEETVARFAERVGMSRQRVMSRFLDDGVVDWLMRSVEAVPPVKGREASALLRGRVGDAADALEFYYRAVEAMAQGCGGRERGNGGAR